MPLEGYELGTIVGGRFRLVRELGEGGAACVFLADDLNAPRPVALKVVREAGGEAAGNLIREAEALRGVEHPRVVGLVESGVLHDQRSFLAMQYAPGDSLRSILRSGPLSVRDALVLGDAIAEALSAIHASGKIHRDLKPGNVLVPIGEGGPLFAEAMLIDLGVFGVMGQRSSNGAPQTRWGRVSGTVWYMAPEQLAGRAQTPATDVYALGILLYEAIFGEVPMAGEEVRELRDSANGTLLAFTGSFVRRRLTESIALPQHPRLTPPVRSFIGGLLHPDPAHRMPCMPDVARSLRELLASEASP